MQIVDAVATDAIGVEYGNVFGRRRGSLRFRKARNHEVARKRMVNWQEMRWSQLGAHLLPAFRLKIEEDRLTPEISRSRHVWPPRLHHPTSCVLSSV
jgi:hypothetical protein